MKNFLLFFFLSMTIASSANADGADDWQDVGFNTIINKLGLRPWNAQNVEAQFGASEVPLYNQAIANGGLIDYEDEIYGEEGLITETKINTNASIFWNLLNIVKLLQVKEPPTTPSIKPINIGIGIKPI